MNEEQKVLMVTRGLIASQSATDQAIIEAIAADIRKLVAQFPGGHGDLAVALVAAELALEAE